MGVHGLTPFLQKTCPSVLKHLPTRFKELQGKRIVIDGTLITQRLHYSPSSHPSRHVLGWYKIAKELNENHVSAVCVFDGKERHVAKSRENQRRREASRLSQSRGTIEKHRFQRLQALRSALDAVEDLPPHKRLLVAKLAEASQVGVKDSPVSMLEETIPDGCSAVQPAPTVAPEHMIPSDLASTPSEVEPLVALVQNLYRGYQSNAVRLASIASQGADDRDKAPPVDLQLTKTQHDLMIREGRVWESFGVGLEDSLSSDATTSPQSLKVVVQDLLVQSYTMLSSFQRRSETPSSQTYADSKEILRAMGIYSIETEGAAEAEGVAASMVRRGLADYVATEDTDVLVYGAPMIRNLTNHSGPLLVISGSEVRESLELSQPSFIDFALLLGTDFCERLKNVGPHRALQFIKEHGSIEQILKSEPKYPPTSSPQAYIAQVEIARSIFSILPPVPSAIPRAFKDDKRVQRCLERHDLANVQRYEEQMEAWKHELALQGNLFHDNPRA